MVRNKLIVRTTIVDNSSKLHYFQYLSRYHLFKLLFYHKLTYFGFQEEDAKPKAVKSSFTVKLTKYDEKQKVAIIKEIKSLIPGTNLVQAKKFIESVPQVVKADLSKEEAEQLKEALVKVGGEVVID